MSGPEGAGEDFLASVQAEQGNLDADPAKSTPEAFEHKMLRYFEEGSASLAALGSEARENPVCDSRDHF